VGYLFGRHGGRAGLRQGRAAARRLLELLELDHAAAQPAGSLNLSERKRLEVARALATGPRLLCLDEVMSGLSPGELDRMAGVIARLRAELGLALLMVEHNVRLVTRICPRVVVLDFGQVIADGPTEAVMADPRVIAAYLGDRHAQGAARA
jgi:branched-chain amino acid transport system ATP-binding protein